MSIQIINDDCIRAMQKLKADGVRVNCCVTSPPYFGLRDYGHVGQIGNEPTPKDFVEAMVTVFRGVRDILTDDGVLWLNLGDSYAGSGRGPSKSFSGRGNEIGNTRPGRGAIGDHLHSAAVDEGAVGRSWVKPPEGFKQKNLIMIPSRVAIALQEDGWYLRAACPWLKRNGMPDSTTSRPTQCIETLFMLTKSRDCFYDAEAVKKMAKTGANGSRFDSGKTAEHQLNRASTAERKEDGKRLRRTSDWFFESWQGMLQDEDGEPTAFVVNTKGYKGAHFATFPPSLIEPCVLSSTSERGCCPDCGLQWVRQVERTAMVIDRSERTHELGRTRSSGTMISPASAVTTGWTPACDCGKDPVPCTVLDPFGGSGTTGEVARKHGRNAVLIELNPEYIPLIQQRLNIPQEATA